MHILKQSLIVFLLSTITFSFFVPKIEAVSFSDVNLFNFAKSIKKPKPSKTPKPTPSPSPSPSGSVLNGAGFEISPASVDLIINLNETKKAFDLKSITAGGFQVYGYPTDYGPGINWTVSSGGMTPGYSTEVGVQVNSNVPVGVYTGTGIVENLDTGEKLTFPVKISVVSPKGFPYVKIKQPDGGESFTEGDLINIKWDSHKITGICQLGYTVGPGTLDWVNFSLPGNQKSQEWVVKKWYQNYEPDHMKITIDCYTDQGLVSDTSDDFFTVNPILTPTPTPTPVSSSTPQPSEQPQSTFMPYPSYSPGSINVGVTISSFSRRISGN